MIVPRYLLGVASSKSLSVANTQESYWCVPFDTEVGDIVLLYCPRSASNTRQGVFAEAIVLARPSKEEKDNCLCSAYGFWSDSALWYVPIKIHRRFKPTLTAKDMKRDSILRAAPFVRRNFQGTSFQLDVNMYKRIIMLVERKPPVQLKPTAPS